jgi:large subunit ribosomal protein L29
MKAADIRKKSLVELREDLANLREDLFNRSFRLGIDEAVKIGRLRGLRRDIARLLTVIKQKELAEKKATSEKANE